MKRSISSIEFRGTGRRRSDTSFAERFARVVAEFGSRYKLAQASGIPASTLQSYTLGSKPGMDQLVTLARVANVDLTWLLTGRGQMRGVAQPPGSALADVIMVDQYDPKSSLLIPTLVNQVPFGRNYLEAALGLDQPTHDSLLALSSVWQLFDVQHGDLLLIDCKQAGLTRDGLYLLTLPGFALRGVFGRTDGKVTIVEPRPAHAARAPRESLTKLQEKRSDSYQAERPELVGDGRYSSSKVVGRVVWIGRAL